MRRQTWVAAALCGLVSQAIAAPASAGEDDRSLSVGLSLARLGIPEISARTGGRLVWDYERGLSEVWAIRGAVGVGYHTGEEGYAYTGEAIVGLTYLIDVLTYVPYLQIGAGGLLLAGEEIDFSVEPAAETRLGLNYLRSRTTSYGIELCALQSLTTATSVVHGGMRITWRWGFF